MTKSEREENDRLVRNGCWICRNVFRIYSPPEIHHVRRLATSKVRSQSPKIPLCPRHHRGPYGVGVHSGRKAFEAKYGTTELALAEEVAEWLKGDLP